MSDSTSIEWTDATWPVVAGCDHISPGCDNCYAARLTGGRLKHLPAYAGLAERGRFNGKVRTLPDRLGWPLRWRKPRKIFVSDMADLFHADVLDEFIAEVFAVMAAAHWHTFQVLTKRHGRLRSLLNEPAFRELVQLESATLAHEGIDVTTNNPWETWPLANVWVGVSVENQRWADIRIPALLDTPAALRFISAEPLLGPINLAPDDHSGHERDDQGSHIECLNCSTDEQPVRWTTQEFPPLDWVIAGGESGPNARPMHTDWPRSLRDQCTAASVPYLFKQWGTWRPQPRYCTDDRHHLVMPDGRDRGTPWPGWGIDQSDAVVMERVGKKRAGRELDGRTWDEYPAVTS